MVKFKKLYWLDSINLTYRKVSIVKLILIFITYTTILTSWCYYEGYNSGLGCVEDRISNIRNTKESLDPTKNKVWTDATFKEYEHKADLYLNRPLFSGTPLSGKLLAHCARNAYEHTGIILPVELALAQAQWESGMGREGRSPINNPYNVGEYDNGTVKWFNSTFEGVQAYYILMTKNYLKCRTTEKLLFNFVNCSGHRYASGDYELHVGQQYYYVKKWLEANDSH